MIYIIYTLISNLLAKSVHSSERICKNPHHFSFCYFEVNSMNEKQTQISEKIASKILRILAIIGLVAVLALATWALVQGAKILPNLGENLSATVTSIKEIFQEAPKESLTFEFEDRTIPVGQIMQIFWTYDGNAEPETYSFSYACGTDATFTVQRNAGWEELTCDTPLIIDTSDISLIPSNKITRFADVTFSVTGNDVTDTTVVTIVNMDIETSATNTNDTNTITSSTFTNTESANTVGSVNNSVPVPSTSPVPTNTVPSSGTQTIMENTTPVYKGPSDLVLQIEETGIILPVDGEDVFFPVSPIQNDKVAGVRFTVINKGGETSEVWNFTAELPIEGNDNYVYESPNQIPLASGMQMEFTLGFDEILKDDKGTIRISIHPNDRNDKTSNNNDSVQISIVTKD